MVVLLLSVVGTLASLGGVYAIVDSRRNRRVKALGFEHTGPIALAAAPGHEQDYQITIHYRPSVEGPDEVISAAYVTYLRFANFGREPIRSQDIAPANPLRVQVEGVRVLDISLAGVHRDVSQIDLAELELGEEKSHADVRFDFLDKDDGGLVRILSTGKKGAEINLVGDIIGMPLGIVRTDKPVPGKSRWGKIGVGLYASLQVVALLLALFAIQQTTGDWSDIWLFVVPFVAVIGPGLIAIAVSETIWPTRNKGGQYPQELALPRWLLRSAGFPRGAYPDFLAEEEIDSGERAAVEPRSRS
jgi:hypothetical protein